MYLVIVDIVQLTWKECYCICSMVKMVNAFAKRSNPPQPTWHEVKYAILRNFGGLDKTRPIEVFEEEIEELAKDEEVQNIHKKYFD